MDEQQVNTSSDSLNGDSYSLILSCNSSIAFSESRSFLFSSWISLLRSSTTVHFLCHFICSLCTCSRPFSTSFRRVTISSSRVFSNVRESRSACSSSLIVPRSNMTEENSNKSHSIVESVGISPSVVSLSWAVVTVLLLAESSSSFSEAISLPLSLSCSFKISQWQQFVWSLWSCEAFSPLVFICSSIFSQFISHPVKISLWPLFSRSLCSRKAFLPSILLWHSILPLFSCTIKISFSLLFSTSL